MLPNELAVRGAVLLDLFENTERDIEYAKAVVEYAKTHAIVRAPTAASPQQQK